jgi:hypothetical protein
LIRLTLPAGEFLAREGACVRAESEKMLLSTRRHERTDLITLPIGPLARA